MENLQKKLNRIEKKIISLKSRDKKFEVFGSGEAWGGHHYILNPRLTEKDLIKFEEKIHNRLPPGYREFLKVLGNGGAGPAYGLLTLSESLNLKTKKRFDKEIFPYQNKEAKKIIKARIKEKLSDLPDWEGTFLELNHEGYLDLASYGCGEYTIIIMNGEQYGKVWYRYENKAYPLYIKKGKGIQQLYFLDWYEQWLDESLSSLSKNPDETIL